MTDSDTRSVLINYLRSKVEQSDWHAVRDAAKAINVYRTAGGGGGGGAPGATGSTTTGRYLRQSCQIKIPLRVRVHQGNLPTGCETPRKPRD